MGEGRGRGEGLQMIPKKKDPIEARAELLWQTYVKSHVNYHHALMSACREIARLEREVAVQKAAREK